MMVVAKYVMCVVLKRGKVTDLSLQNALFYSYNHHFITYHMTTAQFILEQKFLSCQVESVRIF